MPYIRHIRKEDTSVWVHVNLHGERLSKNLSNGSWISERLLRLLNKVYTKLLPTVKETFTSVFLNKLIC